MAVAVYERKRGQAKTIPDKLQKSVDFLLITVTLMVFMGTLSYLVLSVRVEYYSAEERTLQRNQPNEH